MTSLHLTNAFHETSGGVRTVYLALMQQAEREGRRMVLVVPANRDSIEHPGPFSTIYRVRAPRAPLVDRRYRLIMPYRFVWPGAGPLWRILACEQPEVVEVADKYSLCFFAGLLRRARARTGGGPTLIATSSERLDDGIRAHLTRHPGAARLSARYLGAFYIGMFDAHVANSVYTASELRQAMRAPHLRPVHVAAPGVQAVVPPPADARLAYRQRLRARFGIPLDAPCLVYAGRVAREKNVRVLPAVMGHLARTHPHAHLVCVGDGPQRPALETDAGRVAPGRIHFHAHVADRATFFTLLASTDLFLHPNPREPFGIGPLEAMACGVPVVVPASGGVLTYATHENAWLAADDAASLAAAAAAALADPAARQAKILKGRDTAAAFAWPLAASRMFALFDAIHQARLEQA